MNRFLPLAVALLALPAVAADPPKAKAPGKGTNYAFLVGCARYDPKVLEPIKGEETINDVMEFKKALLATGFEETHIVLMHDRQAEKGGAGAAYLPEHDKIVKELDLFLAGLTKDDTAVLVLSGHGVHFKGDKTGFFCPVDANISGKTKLLPFDGDGGIYTKLQKSGAGRKLLIANACRDAPVVPTNDLAGGKIVLDDDTPENVPKGVAAIFSCESGQKSFFDPKQGRSYFFLHLTEAWKAGGTLEDVFAATRTKTMNDVKTARKEKQFPEVKRQYDGAWEIAAASVAGDYDLTCGQQFVHFGKGGEVRAVVIQNDIYAKRYEAWVVDPATGKSVAGPLKHDDGLFHAAISPDGSKAVTMSMNKKAVVWDAKTGDKLATLKHDEMVSHAAFSPDGSRLVTASSDKSAVVWDAKTGNKLATLKHDEAVRRAAFSPDGSKVVTASAFGEAVVWDAKSGEKLVTLKPDDTVADAGFSPDGSKVVTANLFGSAAVWDAKTGEKLVTLKHDSFVNHAAFSPDGSKVVTTMNQGKSATVWDVKTGDKVVTLKHDKDVMQAVFSPDGLKVVTAVIDGSADVWDAKSGDKIVTLKHDSYERFAAFSPDGSKVVTVSSDGSAIWDAKTGEKLGSAKPK